MLYLTKNTGLAVTIKMTQSAITVTILGLCANRLITVGCLLVPTDMVVDKLPSPANMSRERVEKLLCPHTRSFDSLPEQTQKLRDGKQ